MNEAEALKINKFLFEYKIGSIVSYAMFGTLLFVMSQVAVWIFTSIPFVFLPFVLNLSRQNNDLIGFVFWGVAEMTAMGLVVRHVMKPIREILKTDSSTLNQLMDGKFPKDVKPVLLSETILEGVMMTSAAIALLFCFMVTRRTMGLSIVLTTFEMFSFIFMIIFFVVRFLITRKVRVISLISLAGVTYSLWMTFKPFVLK